MFAFLLLRVLLLPLIHPSFAAVIVHRINTEDKFTARSLHEISEQRIANIDSNILKSLNKDNWNTALYQVALSFGQTGNAALDISSVKACHLATATVEHFTLHLTADNHPFSLDYHLSPIPKDGSCPPFTANLSSHQIKNTTLRTSRPSTPPLPILRVPPALTQQGEAVKPQPEKSFLQKYWLYMATALVLILFVGGPPEEEGQPAPGSGSQPAPARR